MRPVRGAPARRHDQRVTPSLIAVGALVVVALVVASILFIRVNRGDEAEGGPVGTDDPTADAAATPSGDQPTDPTDGAGETPEPSGSAEVVSVQAWDPDGDNGTENDAQATLALADGEPSTYWATECYQDRYLGGKRGVGLILTLSDPDTGTLAVTAANAPYQLDVYATAEPTPPTDLTAWNQLGATRFADAPGELEIGVDQTAAHLLVWLKELGPDDACSGANPYRGRLGEISFRP